MPMSELMTDPRLHIAGTASEAIHAERVLDALAQPHVTISGGQASSDDELLAASALYALLCRIFPNTSLELDGALPPNPWGADTIADFVAKQPSAPARPHETPRELVIAVGRCAGPADLYTAGDDWTAIVSRSPLSAFPAPGKHGSLGLHAATALAGSEVVKQALSDLDLQTVPLEAELIWNLLDYRLQAAPATTHTSPAMHQRLLFLGAGSLGSSAIAALSLTDTPGSIEIVDHDEFDPSHNPFRYPAATTVTDGSKVHWLAAMAGPFPAMGAHPHNQKLQDWLAERDSPGFDGTAVVTVDRVDARRDAADLMARHTIAAGVRGLATELHRSTAIDSSMACSYCPHVDVADPYDQVDVYAEVTNLPAARVQELLDGARLTLADLEATGGPIDHRLVGRRFEDLVRAAYAEATLPATSDQSIPIRVSAPHVSWLTGLTIAAEIQKQSLGLPTLQRRLRIDLRGLPLGITDRPEPDLTGRCLCRNPVRQAAARSWYHAD